MEILAHRGSWDKPENKNSLSSLEKAFLKNYGIETDIRDYKGRLVISHNIADEESVDLETFLQWYHDNNCTQTLALNVKADGIQTLLAELLEKYCITNYFLFDMSVPEAVVNRSRNLNYYTRHSDIEPHCVLYDDACGVWLDSFFDFGWIGADIIKKHLEDGKEVCLVSPELHGRDKAELWNMIKYSMYVDTSRLKLCTDCPDDAKVFFNE